jgi:hypothetical protein
MHQQEGGRIVTKLKKNVGCDLWFCVFRQPSTGEAKYLAPNKTKLESILCVSIHPPTTKTLILAKKFYLSHS